MVSDETAYRKYLAGDEAAAQLLVERYGDALTLYINGVLGDIHEAEDLMIEAFAHIFARERPIQDGCFKAYLYKTGRNLALRCKTRRRFFLPLEELPFELPDEALAETGSLQNEQHQQQRYYRSAAEHESDDGNYALGAYKADEQAGNDKDAAACYECGQSAVERKTYRLAARNIALPQLKISV